MRNNNNIIKFNEDELCSIESVVFFLSNFYYYFLCDIVKVVHSVRLISFAVSELPLGSNLKLATF